MNWTDLVKSRIKEMGITQEKLAEMVEVTPGGMGHWLNKRREPSLDQIAKILKALNLQSLTLHSDGSLEYPEIIEKSNVSTLDIQPKYQGRYPLISSVQPGAWAEACEPYQVEETSEWYETTEKVIGKGFWLRVVGDSMTSPTGVSFPEGTMILVDTGRDHENKSLVVAKLTDVNEATFKRFVVDAGMQYLMPLNPT